MWGNTDTAEAFDLAREMLERRPGKGERIAYLLHVTDGRATHLPRAKEVVLRL